MNMTYQPPRGTRDFLPEEMSRRQYIISTIREVYELFGFRPLETPAFESWDLLSAKGGGGEEIRNEVYYFRDKADRELGLRFDLTVPLVRVVASNPQLTKPFKRYQIQPVWRYDNPQAGRWREFWQADADIVGSAKMRCEAELIAVAVTVLSQLNIRNYEIRLNNRKILNGLVSMLNIGEKQSDVFRILDKLEKIGQKEVERQLGKMIRSQATQRLVSLVIKRGDAKKMLQASRKIFESVKEAEEGIAELEEIIQYLSAYGIPANITVDFSMVRGLEYYTGPIFEIVSTSSTNPGSICGGGRYDRLVELYGGKPTPCTGLSFGIDRLYALLEGEGKLGMSATTAPVYVLAVNEKVLPAAIQIAQQLRQEGIATETDLAGRDMRKQLDYVNSVNIPFALFVGEKELKENKFTLRDMKTGQQRALTREEVVTALRTRAQH